MQIAYAHVGPRAFMPTGESDGVWFIRSIQREITSVPIATPDSLTLPLPPIPVMAGL